MNLLKVKNLVIRSIKPLASSVCLISLPIIAANSFGSYRTKEPQYNPARLETIMKTQDKELKEYFLEEFNKLIEEKNEFVSGSPKLSLEQIMENEKNNLIINQDIDYIFADAYVKKEELKLQYEQEYIDNLITIYENGYDEINDVEIDTENFELTTDNKTYEDLDDEAFEFFVACVAAECNGTTHDALATASSVLNRCDSERWQTVSDNPVEHLTAGGQYSVYSSGLYKQFLGFNVSDEVLDACTAVWYNGIRNNNYCSFRGNSETYYSDIQVVDGGNRFGDELVKEKNK